MDENKQIEERIELENIISDAIRDYEDYCEDCYESGDYRVFDYEESIADSILSAGYRKQSEGEWIEYIEIGAMNNRLNCSVCNWQTPFCAMGKREFKFCPNCGAKMKGE